MLAMRRKIYGNEHPSVALSLYNVGTALIEGIFKLLQPRRWHDAVGAGVLSHKYFSKPVA